MLANVSYPPLSKYMRTKVRLHMTASHTWITRFTARAYSVPCDLCPPAHRLISRTLVSFSYRIGPKEEYAICYKCMSRLHLRREREQPWAELRLYAPIRARRLEHGR